MWIALYVNCIAGRFKPVGPFESELDAGQWILDNAEEPGLWEAMEVQDAIGEVA